MVLDWDIESRRGCCIRQSLEAIPLDLEMEEDGLRDVVGAREGIGIVAWKSDLMDDE